MGIVAQPSLNVRRKIGDGRRKRAGHAARCRQNGVLPGHAAAGREDGIHRGAAKGGRAGDARE